MPSISEFAIFLMKVFVRPHLLYIGQLEKDVRKPSEAFSFVLLVSSLLL